MVKYKKLVNGFLFILVSVVLTGCISGKTREEILNELREENIIKDNWNNIYNDVTSAAPIPDILSYEYYYEDENGVIYEISICRGASENEDTQKYKVRISNNMEERNETETYTDPETNEIMEREEINYYKTEETETTKYDIYKRNVLFGDKLKIKKEG